MEQGRVLAEGLRDHLGSCRDEGRNRRPAGSLRQEARVAERARCPGARPFARPPHPSP